MIKKNNLSKNILGFFMIVIFCGTFFTKSVFAVGSVQEGEACDIAKNECATGLVCKFPPSGGATSYCGKGQQGAGKLEDGLRCSLPSDCLGGFCEIDSVGNKVCGHSPSPQSQNTLPVTPTKLKYQLLESFPGFYAAKENVTDFQDFVLSLYKFGIWTVGIAGLFMMVVGGIMYMTSAGNTSSAGSAKGVITDALVGIIAALGAYLFVYVINPDLVKINLNFTAVEIPDVGDVGGGGIVNDKGNQSTSGGCIKPVNAARARESWVYNQQLRGQTVNNITYTDCSHYTSASYIAAGCISPGSNTTLMYAKGKAWNRSTIKAGDLIVNYAGGHVVMCMDDGCSQVIEAPGTGKPISIKNGDYFTSKAGTWEKALVIRAIDYCRGC